VILRASGEHARSERRRGALRNAAYAVVEYLSQPLGILLAAPYLLRHLGAAQFGVWVLAGAAVNSGNLLSSGFGDAAIKYVAMYRGRGDSRGIERVVRGMIAINLALSALAAAALWFAAPYIAAHVARFDLSLKAACLESLRIGCVLLVVRSVDSVFGSTLRAFERYSPAVRIATCFRFAVLAAAVVIAASGRGVVPILFATLALAFLAAVAQGIAVRIVAGRIILLPAWSRQTLTQIAGFGCFSWVQAACAVAFGQADRLVVGIVLGAPAVAIYALCAQVAQSIHGATAAGLHVLFPHLSSRIETEPLDRVRTTVWSALRVNLAAAAAMGATLALLGWPILNLWMGAGFAQRPWPVFSVLAVAYAVFAMNVTAHYALLALGRVRLVTALNVAAGLAMLALMLPLASRFGIVGAACARLVTGPITCLMYLPLLKLLRGEERATRTEPTAIAVWENG
jgi:O-antigen/teichoic acid export membrane protein